MPNTQNPQKSIWKKLQAFFGIKKRSKKVYFVSGMCNPCSVFDNIILPEGYEKVYIEWLIPKEEELLEAYTIRMSEKIDKSEPFILIGYSFGGIIVQLMNAFLDPTKTIIISSMKSEKEIPQLFKFAKASHFFEYVPKSVYGSTNFVTDIFTRYLYELPTEEVRQLMTITDPVYVRWSIEQITHWTPKIKCENLYHIHGTKDQIFPFRQIDNVYGVINGDHLMVIHRAEEISALIDHIILEK